VVGIGTTWPVVARKALCSAMHKLAAADEVIVRCWTICAEPLAPPGFDACEIAVLASAAQT